VGVGKRGETGKKKKKLDPHEDQRTKAHWRADAKGQNKSKVEED